MIDDNDLLDLENSVKGRQAVTGQMNEDYFRDLESAVNRPEPGFVKSVAGDIAGGLVDLGEMYARAGRALPGGEPSGANLGGLTSKAINWANDFRRKNPSLDVNPNRTGLSRWFHEGVRSAVTSIASGLPGAAAGALTGSLVSPIGTAVGGVLGYATSAATTFGLSEYDQFMEEGLKSGLTPEQIEPAAIRSGLYEGGIEFAADVLEGKLLGGGIFTPIGKEALRNGIGSMFKTTIKDMLKRGAGLTAIEVGTEMLQGGLEAEERYQLGIGNDRFVKAAADAFGPSLVASLIFAGLGEHQARRISRNIRNDLENPNAPIKDRYKAVAAVTGEIKPTSEKVAQYWFDNAMNAIDQGQPIDLSTPLPTDAEIDAKIMMDQTLADEAVKNAMNAQTVPIDKDVQDWNQSLQTNPMGDDQAAQNILQKLGSEQPVVVPRGQGAEELRAQMREAENLPQIGQMGAQEAQDMFSELEASIQPPGARKVQESEYVKNLNQNIEKPKRTENEQQRIDKLNELATAARTKQNDFSTAIYKDIQARFNEINEGKFNEKTTDETINAAQAEIKRIETNANVQAQGQEKGQVLKQQVDETKANKLTTLLAEAIRLGPRFFPKDQANALRSAERDYRLGNMRDKFADSVISEAEGVINASRNNAEVWWQKEVPTLEAKKDILKSLGIRRSPRIDWRSLTQTQTEQLTNYFKQQQAPKTIDQEIAQASEADIDRMLTELEPKSIQTGTEQASEKITKPETAPASQRQTKKEKALKTYQDYVAGLKPETKEAVKDLIKENPQSPGSALLKLMRAVNKLPAPEQVSAPAQAALDPWQMTQEEFAAKSVGGRPIIDDRKASKHRKFVKIALEEGKPVPEKVLKDYPDLVKTAPVPAQRSASDIIKSAAKEGVKGIDESLKGLHDLFGGSSLKSLLGGIDPETYAKAKPHFKSAIDSFRAAGKDLAEFVRWAYSQFGAGIKPYLKQFLMDTQKEAANVQGESRAPTGAGVRTNREEVSGEPGEVTPGGERVSTAGEPVPQGTVEGQGAIGSGGRTGVQPVGAGGPGAEVAATAEPGAVRQNIRMGRENRQGLNHVIQPDQILAPKGNEGKIRGNIKAIDLIKKLDAEDRNPTPAEQQILAQYVGWGSFGQKVFAPAFDEYASKFSQRHTPENWFYRPEQLKAYKAWQKKYGKKLHPALGGTMTQEEWDSAKNSTQNAHYTSRPVIEKMWDLVRRLGFTQGNVLEPAAGVGHFIGLMPGDLADKSAVFAVEKDQTTGRILSRLYPQANVQVTPFERSRGLAPNSMDLVISNVPFGKITIRDRNNKEFDRWSIHNYFIGRSIDAVKPGGMVVAITSSFTLDARSNTKIRNTLGNKADLVGAIRLPNTAFQENANTEVVTDILVFRKKDSATTNIGNEFDIVQTLEDANYQAKIDAWNTAKDELQAIKNIRSDERGNYQAWKNRRDRKADEVAEKLDAIQNSPAINRYFIANPDMVLGAHAETGKMFRKDSYTVTPTGDLQEQLAQAIETFPQNIAGEGTDLTGARPVEIATKEKEGTLFMRDGKLKMVVGGRIVDPEYIDSKGNLVKADKPHHIQKMTRYVGVKESATNLINAMNDPKATDEELDALRAQLNERYDDYVKNHKIFNSVGNSFLRKMDNDFAVVDALEIPVDKDEKGATIYQKAPMFTRRTVFPFQEPRTAGSIEDAVNLSLVYRGEIDLGYLSQLTGIEDRNKLRKEVVAKNLGFINPSTGLLEQRDQYLSGNVKIKLAKAREAALNDKEYERNVKALEPIIPADLDISFVSFRLGSSWIPTNVIQTFASEVLGIPIIVNKGQDNRGTFWKITPRDGDKNNLITTRNLDTWGSGQFSGSDLMLMNLNLKQAQARRPVYENGRTTMVNDEQGTAAAQLKQIELNNEFVRWAKTHETVGPEMTKIYNREKNGTVLREHKEPEIDVYPNASEFDLDGETPLRLRSHQKIAVSRNLQESVLLAYGVGTGKTMIYVTTAMEMKRIGTASKPLIVSYNSTIDQYRKEFSRLYPGAKVLIPDEQQRNAKYRKKLLASIATGDWDAIVLPQSTFDGLANNPDRERAYVQEQIDIYQEALEQARDEEGARSFRVTELQNLIDNRRQRLENMLNRRKDEALTFEQLGIDALLIDEAHAYKRSEFFTKMDRVKGIDNGYADRSASLLLKSRFIQEKTGGKNVILATGTPISNTMAELWTMLRYVRPDLLEEFGASSFDDFASSFGIVTSDVEMTASRFKVVNRFSKYINGPELLSMFFRGADVRLTQNANLKLPEVVGGEKPGQAALVKIEKNQTLRSVMNSIIRQWRNWENLSGREKRRTRHMPLLFYQMSKKAAVDLRYLDPVRFGDDPNSKINVASKKIAEIYHKHADDRATQIVFNDLIVDNTDNPRFNGHEEMKRKLVELGVKPDDIILYSLLGSEKKEDAAKELIRTSQARIIIGTTEKLGIGVDIAQNMIAAHHVSVPDRPMDIEQRNGRILRQSNRRDKIMIFQYAIEDTLDSVMFSRLTMKQKMADQVLSGKIEGREFDDPYSDEQASFAHFAAASSGKAGKLLFERADLENKMRQWQAAEQNHIVDVSHAKRMIHELPGDIERQKGMVKEAQDVAANISHNFPNNKFDTITYDGQEMPRKEAYDAIKARIDRTMEIWQNRFIGKPASDFMLVAQKVKGFGDEPRYELTDHTEFTIGDFKFNLDWASYTRHEALDKPLEWFFRNQEGFNARTVKADVTVKYKGQTVGQFTFDNDRIGDLTRKINSNFKRLQEVSQKREARLTEMQDSLKEYQQIAVKPFAYIEDMNKAATRIDEIQHELQGLDLSAEGANLMTAHEAIAEYKNGLMQLMAAAGATTEDLNEWRDGLVNIANNTTAIGEYTKGWFDTKEATAEITADVVKKTADYIDRMAEFTQTIVDQSAYLDVIGEPLSYQTPKDINAEMAMLPEGTMRFALGNSSQSIQDVQKAAGLITQAMQRAGLPMSILDRVRLSLSPVVDIAGADVDKTLSEWGETGKNVNTVLGATTINGTNALVQLSLAQDLKSMERTAYHESFHLASKWLLPDQDYQRLIDYYGGNEEATAEAFADFVQGTRGDRKAPIGIVRRTMIYLRDVLARLGNLLRGKGYTRPEDMFKDIVDGKYQPQENWTDSTSFMAEQWAAKWRSQMRDQMSKLPGKGTPQQMADTLQAWAKKGIIKQEELEWSGVIEELGNYKGAKIGRREVLKLFDDSAVQLAEITRGDYSDIEIDRWISEVDASVNKKDTGNYNASYMWHGERVNLNDTYPTARDAWEDLRAEAAYQLGLENVSQYVDLKLPGGTDYHEMQLVFPTAASKRQGPTIYHVVDAYGEVYGGDFTDRANAERSRDQMEKDLDEELFVEAQAGRDVLTGVIGGEPSKEVFMSSHWPNPNVVAHARFQTMTGKNGEKILIVEENQSDWHQEGRQNGYNAGKWEVFDPKTEKVVHVTETEEEARKLAEAKGLDYDLSEGVPNAPFKTSWPLLVMKRMVRYAAENGFDYVAWPSGQIQADRYDLSKPVGSFHYRPEDLKAPIESRTWYIIPLDKSNNPIQGAQGAPMTGANYGDIKKAFGQDIADQIYNGMGQQHEMAGVYKIQAPEGLTVGGTGMLEFYDKIVPSFMKSFFGKTAWGSPQVYQIKLPQAKEGWDLALKARRPQQFQRTIEPTVWVMPVTPQMRRKALTEGMTMFAMAQRDIYSETLPDDVAERFKGARLKAKTLKEKVGVFITDTIKIFTPGNKFPTLAHPTFAAAREILRNASEVPNYSKWRAAEDLKEILQPKDLSPAQYDLFGLKIILDDMKKDLDPETGVLAGWQAEHEELPFGFRSEEDLDASIARTNALIDQDPTIQRALARRQDYMLKLRHDLVAAKLLPAKVLNEPRYYHHQVLEHMENRYSLGTGSRDVRVHKKGYQYHRKGSIKEYNTEYLQSEYEVIAQGISQLELKKNIDEIGDEYNIIGELRQKAKAMNYLAVVGGPENMARLNQLRAEKAYIDDPRDERTKMINEEIWLLDPTMQYRQKIAIGLSKLRGAGLDYGNDIDDIDMHAIAQLADDGEIGALMVLKAINERESYIQEALGPLYRTWRTEMRSREPLEGSAGWAEWIPKPGSAWYMTNNITDKTVEQVLSGQRQLTEADVRQVLARGYDARWVLPTEVAAAMDGQDFLQSPHENPVAWAAEKTLNAWKQWILINPMRVLKYNLNNTSGDADIVFAYRPEIFRYTKQAAKDLYLLLRDRPLTAALKAEIDEGMRDAVIGSGITAHDIPELTKYAQFDELMQTLRPNKNAAISTIKRFWTSSKSWTTWRENVLRLAAYRYFKDQIRQGKKVYGVSDRDVVDITTDSNRKAALLARELVGDYGNISKGGQWLRRKMIPFYSWMEINAPRYWRLFKNLPIEGESSRLRAGAVLTKKGALLTARMTMLFTLVNLFNKLFWPEEEEELGASGRRQMHLILGRNEDGTIQTLRIQGALSDALSWIGLENLPEDVSELVSGKKTLGEQAQETALAPVNKIIQGLRPDIKMPAELLTGRTLYPEVTRPRPIRDRGEYIARMFSLDKLYNRLSGKPSKEKDVFDKVLADLGATVTYTSDPEQASYYDTRSMAAKYMETQGIENPPSEPTSRSNALYYYRQAIKYGDGPAAMRYLKKYVSLGGTLRGLRTSIQRAHPLAMLPKRYWTPFVASLGPEDRRTIQRAITWYNRTYNQ